jgi:hypothetical protein
MEDIADGIPAPFECPKQANANARLAAIGANTVVALVEALNRAHCHWAVPCAGRPPEKAADIITEEPNDEDVPCSRCATLALVASAVEETR